MVFTNRRLPVVRNRYNSQRFKTWKRLLSCIRRNDALACLLVVAVCVYLTIRSLRGGNTGTGTGTDTDTDYRSMDTSTEITSYTLAENQCWLKQAHKKGEFVIFSHRTYVNSALPQQQQPSCHDALQQLKNLGIHHIDIDLVLDEAQFPPRLVVAHPMEYNKLSKYYSPCANTELDNFIQLLEHIYDNGDFFLSMEPKAAWGNTPVELDNPALANLPSKILERLLNAIQRNVLSGDNCAAIVEIPEGHVKGRSNEEIMNEEELLSEILDYCQWFKGVRFVDGAVTSMSMSMGDYDMIMPSIEFHPRHPHNLKQNRNDGVIPRKVRENALFWVVDDEDMLELAADLRPAGIVSNSPENIVAIIDGWCSQ